MDVYTDFEGGSLVFRLIGELDEHSAQFVRKQLDTAITEYDSYDCVIFDLSRLSFMDSTGIGVIIGRYKLIRKANKPVYVRKPTSTVDKIFRMSGLYEIISKI